MERKKGDLLLSWQKKPVGIYLGGIEYYSFERSMVVHIHSFKCLKVLFYTEDGFRGVDLSYANLRRADLEGANLQNAYLQGADLSVAYLRNANLRGADLSNIKYDKDTVWPEGFKP